MISARMLRGRLRASIHLQGVISCYPTTCKKNVLPYTVFAADWGVSMIQHALQELTEQCNLCTCQCSPSCP